MAEGEQVEAAEKRYQIEEDICIKKSGQRMKKSAM